MIIQFRHKKIKEVSMNLKLDVKTILAILPVIFAALEAYANAQEGAKKS